MNEKKGGFRLRLNLFDAIILLIALGAAGFLLWSRLAPSTPAVTDGGVAAPQTVTYTIRLKKTVAGTADYVNEGDALIDAVKNASLGTVESFSVSPATALIIDEDALSWVYAPVPGKEDIDLIVTASAGGGDGSMLVGADGYEIKVGAQIFVRGPGYSGGGYVVAIDRPAGQEG